MTVHRLFAMRGRLAPCTLAVLILLTATAHGQAPRPRPSQPAPPSNRGGATSRGATLVIETDLACALTVDGESKGNLDASGSTKMTLQRGEHIIRCVATEDSELVWRKSVEVTSDQSKAAVIELKPLRDAKEKETAAKREQEKAAAETAAANEARSRAQAQAAQEQERRQDWIRRLEGNWRSSGETGTTTNGQRYEDAGTTLVMRRSGDGLVGTVRTDVTYYKPWGPYNQITPVREETVVELNVDISGPSPVATLIRGQFFERNNAQQNPRFVLTDFEVTQGATRILVRVEYADGAWYRRNFTR